MKILKKIAATIFAFVIAMFTVHAQLQEDLKTYFNDGEYFIAYGDYQEALFNYLKIEKKGITNPNIQYRIGQCYINLEGQKTKAIPYLESASKLITLNYQEGNVKEIQAPIDAFFFLGVAYQVNNEFDKAIDSYRKYIALLPKEDILSYKFTKQQEAACKNAKEALEKPANITIELLKEPINNVSPNMYPIMAPNDSMFVYLNKMKFYDALTVTVLNSKTGLWSNPKNINQEILSDGFMYPTSVSADGKTIYLGMNDNFNSDIYYTNYNNETKKWSPYSKLKGVNTKFWESNASISQDGKFLYFSSNNPKNNIGGMDIFVCERINDKWSEPINLGTKINTEFNEEAPYITNDGNRLFFVSQGNTKNIGGYDIFYSDKSGNGWGPAVHLPYPINTSDDETFFSPTADGEAGYLSRINDTIPKNGFDIYKFYLTK